MVQEDTKSKHCTSGKKTDVSGCGSFTMETSTDKTITALNCLLDSYYKRPLLGEFAQPLSAYKPDGRMESSTEFCRQDKCVVTDDTLQDKLHTNNPNIERLVRTVGEP